MTIPCPLEIILLSYVSPLTHQYRSLTGLPIARSRNSTTRFWSAVSSYITALANNVNLHKDQSGHYFQHFSHVTSQMLITRAQIFRLIVRGPHPDVNLNDVSRSYSVLAVHLLRSLLPDQKRSPQGITKLWEERNDSSLGETISTYETVKWLKVARPCGVTSAIPNPRSLFDICDESSCSALLNSTACQHTAKRRTMYSAFRLIVHVVSYKQ
jgi:hypothetical protein